MVLFLVINLIKLLQADLVSALRVFCWFLWGWGGVLGFLFFFNLGGFLIGLGILYLNITEKSLGFLHLFLVLHQFCIISFGY